MWLGLSISQILTSRGIPFICNYGIHIIYAGMPESLIMVQEENYISCTAAWRTSKQVLDRRKPDMAGELNI